MPRQPRTDNQGDDGRADYATGRIARTLAGWEDLLDGAVSLTVKAGTDWAAAERLLDTRADVWCALRWLAGFNRQAAALVVATYHDRREDEHDDDRDDRLAAMFGWRRGTLRRFRGEALDLLAGYLNEGDTGA